MAALALKSVLKRRGKSLASSMLKVVSDGSSCHFSSYGRTSDTSAPFLTQRSSWYPSARHLASLSCS